MTQADLQRQVAERRAHSRSASIPRPQQQQQQQPSAQHNPNSMNMNGAMTGGDSLDDIIMQKQSRVTTATDDSNLTSFQFGTPTPASENPMLRRQSTGELDLGIVYGNMGAEMNMQMPQMGYSDSVQPSPMSMDASVGYPGFTGDMVPGMMSYVPLGMEGMSQDSSMGMYAGNNYSPSMYGNDHMDSMDSDFMMGSHDGMRTMSGNMNDENDEARSGLSVMVQSPANDLGMSQNV
ncbi:hypothetical protein EYC84_009188 [Monilinia fructicola]|uniref:Uncharacterized protein n=1 Tax=Monilinia fructicola TaxID=38448 RepID=A0A5M9JDF4_MONFR|nr:hypothetical protein EYC84_009188 [Monilinia fructicola]